MTYKDTPTAAMPSIGCDIHAIALSHRGGETPNDLAGGHESEKKAVHPGKDKWKMDID